ncbi:MAG TPA: hypothetical protein VKZ63_10525, partial [Kofleriaceae bacterium]|nr:hypothetical protein [Kofleriaceae bacterium]
IAFAEAIGLEVPAELARAIHQRVRAKLEREPIEDFRIDFEDGYGNRPDEEEDGHARAAALEVAAGMANKSLPPYIGIRIKPLTEELARRALRTLDIFVSTVVRESGGALPDNFVVTLPKITCREQIEVLCSALGELETRLGLAAGSLPIEFMIETTQSIVDADGGSNLPRFLEAAAGRCVAAHFGTYDYTASCNITAAHQRMTHPACDFARHMMQVAYSGRGIWLSDGATNIMPVPVHRAAKDGPPLTAAQQADNRRSVHEAWRLHASDIRHSLVHGYYQGWDLHPGQLPTRYAAVYAFFLEGLPAASQRLKNFVAKAAQATLVGDVFDDAATGQGLLNFFLRGIGCGAFGEEEALATGLTVEELRSRSFVQILNSRRARGGS